MSKRICWLVSLLLLWESTLKADQTINYWVFPGEPSSIHRGDAYQGTFHVAIGTQTHLTAGGHIVTAKVKEFAPDVGWGNPFGDRSIGFQVDEAGRVISSDTGPIGPNFGYSVSQWENAHASGGNILDQWTAYFNGEILKQMTTLRQGEYILLPIDYSSPPADHVQLFTEDFPLTPQGKPCNTCSSGSCPIGGGATVGSLEYVINLGRNQASEFSVANELSIKVKTPTADLATPIGLRVNYFNEGGNETIFGVDFSPRQVVGPQSLADIIVLTPFKYQVKLYPTSSKGEKNVTTGLYQPSGSPTKIITIENPNGTATSFKKLHITEAPGDGGSVGSHDYLYVFTGGVPMLDPAGQWELVSESGLRHETLKLAKIDATTRSETRTVSDGLGRVVSKVVRTFKAFPWGDEVVSEVVDPDGAALTTTYDYWQADSSDPSNPQPDYRNWANHLKQRVESSGRWERYEYDSLNRPTKKVEQFLDAPLNAPDNQCRVTTTSYSGTTPLMETEIQTLRGVEVTRHYKRYLGQGKVQDIVCQVPGAPWDDANNLVTTTVTDGNGDPTSVRQPDGVLTTYVYTLSGGTKYTVMSVGAADPSGITVIDGSRTTTVTDGSGQQILQTVEDISSGLLVSSATTTQSDATGRPTRVVNADGTFELTSYDCCGVSSRTDRNGVLTTYSYDALMRLSSETMGGVTSRYTYDSEGRRLSTVREGSDGSLINIERLTYDVAGRLISRTDALNYVTSFIETRESGSGHTVRTTTLPDDGHSTKVETYAQDGQLLGVSGSGAHPLAYAYDVGAAGEWTQEIRLGSAGETTEWTKTFKDAVGRAYKTLGANGATTQSFFNSKGQQIRSVDPDGVTTLFAYNTKGEQDTVAVDMDRNGQIDLTGKDRVMRSSTAVVSAHNLVVTRTTSSAWTTDDADVSAVVGVTEQSVDERSTWQTDAGGLTTQSVTTCDGAGICTTTVTAPDGSYTVRVIQNGRAIAQTRFDANAQSLSGITMDYEAHGRLWHQTDARNGATTLTYDAADQLRSASHGGQTTSYDYDALRRKTLQTEPDLMQIKSEYWPTGELKSTGGARTYPQYYTYDSQGRMKSLTTQGQAGPATTTWNYDGESGQMIGRVYADNHGPSYTYTLGGKVATRTWARGIVTTYGYDHAGQLASITYSDGTTVPAVYTYDRLGRTTTASGGGSARLLSYRGNTILMTSETSTAGSLTGMSVETGYDALLRRTSLQVKRGGANLVSQNFGFDAASRLANASQGTTSAEYGYWPNSAKDLVHTITFKRNEASVMTTTDDYDFIDRLTKTTSTASGSETPASSFAYSYNAANQRVRTELAPDGTAWLYEYDRLGQITRASRQWSDGSPVGGQQYGYGYDAIGNRKSVTTNGRSEEYTANLLNEYSRRTVPGVIDVTGIAAASATVSVNEQKATREQGGYFYSRILGDNSAGVMDVTVNVSAIRSGNETSAVNRQQRHVLIPKTPEEFQYDLDGNLINDGLWTYSWDVENCLLKMEESNPPPTVERKMLTFAYDDLGRRVQKTAWLWNASTGNYQLQYTRLFAYEGWDLISETVTDNVTDTQVGYLWNKGGGDQETAGLLLFSVNAPILDDTSYMAVSDGNSNIVQLVRADDGSCCAQYEYGPFGEMLRSTDTESTRLNSLRWSSKYFDEETKFVYFGRRYYNQCCGSWLSRDPVQEIGGLNIFGYLSNDPINWRDAYGLAATGGVTFTGTDQVILNVQKTGIRVPIDGPSYHFGVALVCYTNNLELDYKRGPILPKKSYSKKGSIDLVKVGGPIRIEGVVVGSVKEDFKVNYDITTSVIGLIPQFTDSPYGGNPMEEGVSLQLLQDNKKGNFKIYRVRLDVYTKVAAQFQGTLTASTPSVFGFKLSKGHTDPIGGYFEPPSVIPVYQARYADVKVICNDRIITLKQYGIREPLRSYGPVPQ